MEWVGGPWNAGHLVRRHACACGKCCMLSHTCTYVPSQAALVTFFGGSSDSDIRRNAVRKQVTQVHREKKD